MLLDAALPYAAAVKPNLAFFEAFGSAGIAALERLRGRVPADVPFVADAKRGDIGSTAARQAVALYDILGADAITANPYLGSEAIEPLIARGDRFAYLLCRTSNPGAGELQGLEVAADRPSAPRPSRSTHGSPGGRRAGARAGPWAWSSARPRRRSWSGFAASRPGLALLVPGVGAQGGEVEPVLRFGPAVAAPAGGRPGGGLLVNVSRGISGAAGTAGEPPTAAAEQPDRRHVTSANSGTAAAREWAAPPTHRRLSGDDLTAQVHAARSESAAKPGRWLRPVRRSAAWFVDLVLLFCPRERRCGGSRRMARDHQNDGQ